VPSAELDGQTAGDWREFALDLTAANLEKGHLQVIVRSTAINAETGQIYGALASDAEAPCTADVIRSDLEARIGGSSAIGPPVVVPVDIHLPTSPFMRGFTRRISFAYTFEGKALVWYADVVNLISGRLRVTMTFEASERVELGLSAWDQSVASSRELYLIQAAAHKLTDYEHPLF